jgi:hypothetical protein
VKTFLRELGHGIVHDRNQVISSSESDLIEIHFLLQAGNTPLHVATSPDVARILIDSGARVDEQNNVMTPPDHFLSLTFSKDGNTPLHLACQNSFTDMIRILLRRSLDPFIENQVRVPSFPLLHKRYHRDQNHQTALELVDLETPGVEGILELFFRDARVRQTHRHPSLHSFDLLVVSTVSSDSLSKGSREIIHKFCPKTE